MSKSERIKEEIGWLKVAFGIAMAVDVSLIAWLAQNYDKAKPAVLVAAVLVAIIASLAVGLVNRRAYRNLDELEKL